MQLPKLAHSVMPAQQLLAAVVHIMYRTVIVLLLLKPWKKHCGPGFIRTGAQHPWELLLLRGFTLNQVAS
jgi:hypothetical protein